MVKFRQLYIATDAHADRDGGDADQFFLSFPTEDAGCTVVLRRPTLKQLQDQIAYVLSQEGSER